MTTIYFVRHAEPNYNNHDDLTRELTEKGLADRILVTNFLSDKSIDVVLSSPFKRTVDTIKDFTDKYNHSIITVNDFRERKVGDDWISNFSDYTKKQWSNFDYKLKNGESLGEVQQRNILALKEVLLKFEGKTMVIGTHGTALSTIINYFDNSYGYEIFKKIRHKMPWIVKMQFEEQECKNIQNIEI